MYIYEYEDKEYIALTYLDELCLAKAVMDCIALRWVQGEFQRLLDQIYYIKCTHGTALKTDMLDRLLYFMEERYADELESLGIKPPDLEDNDSAIWADLSYDEFPTRQERIEETRRQVIKAWREVWDRHAAHKMAADGYKTFPGDNWRDHDDYTQKDMDDAQETLERAFWAEVDKTCDMYAEEGYDVPRHMVIKQVEDYMPRRITDVELE